MLSQLARINRLPCLSFPFVDLRPPLSDAARSVRCCSSLTVSARLLFVVCLFVHSSACPLVYSSKYVSPPAFKRQDGRNRKLRRQEREMIFELDKHDDTQSLITLFFPVKANLKDGNPDWFIRLFFHWDVSL